MKQKSFRFKLVDALYILMMVLPIAFAITLNVLTKPVSDKIAITGARIFFTVDLPLGGLPITEAQVNSWMVIISVLGLCLFMTHGLKIRPESKRQLAVEWIVEKCTGLVKENMGEIFLGFAPFVAAIMALSGFSSLLSLFGLFPPTSDINITGGWAILVFILITYYKFKCGPLHYIKSFGDPVPLLAPFNIISEVATPVSMAFRHYGNVLSGTIVSVLIASGLQGLSSMLLGWLPGFLSEIPFLQIGIPAFASVYFDIFSGCLQAYIFATLTMLYVANAFPLEDYEKRKARKQEKKAAKARAKAN